MRQPVAEVIGEAAGEDLRFVFQPPEGARMDDAVTIAVEFVAVGVRVRDSAGRA